MDLEKNDNWLSKQNDYQSKKEYNQTFIEDEILEQKNVLNNFLNVYNFFLENKNSSTNVNLEIFNNEDLFQYFKEIDQNFKFFFDDQKFINKVTNKEKKRIGSIKNKLMFMISNASRYLSNFLEEKNDLYNFKFNKIKNLDNLKDDFFGRTKTDLIFDDLIFNNKKFLKELNKSFPLSKISINLNTKKLSLENNNLKKYYLYIFKNIYWLRTLLEHKEDLSQKAKERLNIPIAILSLLLINDFYAKINFNSIKEQYIYILNNQILKIKNIDNKENLNYENNKFNIIIKIERIFNKQLNILLSEENKKLPYNDFESLDKCIKEAEKSFNLFQYKDLLMEINRLENFSNEENLEEKSFFYKKRDFYRQKYLYIFDQWSLFIFNFYYFLFNQYKLVEINKDKIIFFLKKILFQEIKKYNTKIIEEKDNKNLINLLCNFFEIKTEEKFKFNKKIEIFEEDYDKNLSDFLFDFYKNIILKQDNNFFKKLNVSKIIDINNELLIKVFKINKYFLEIEKIFNGYKHNRNNLFYIKDVIDKKQKNFKELIIYFLEIANKLVYNFKKITKNDWFYLKDMNESSLKQYNKIKEDYRSNVLLQFSRLISNFTINLSNLNNKENYFEKIEEKVNKKIKVFNKNNLNQKYFDFSKFKKEILEKYYFYPNSKSNIEKFYDEIDKIRKNKGKALKIIKEKQNYFNELNINFEIDNKFKIQYIENKKLDFEFQNEKDLLNFIKNKKSINEKELLLYYQSVLNYNKSSYKISSLNDINEEIINELIKWRAFIKSKKYYLYNIEKLKDANQIEQKAKLFFNNWLFLKLNEFDNLNDFKNFLREKYLKSGLMLNDGIDKKLWIDKNLGIYNHYTNAKKNREIAKKELWEKYLKNLKNKNHKYEWFPTKTLFFLNGHGIKKNIINLTTSRDFKNSFYNGKIRKKDNFNFKLLKNNFDFLIDKFDFNNNKFTENFNFIDLNYFIENKIKEQNKEIKLNYFNNLILEPIKSFKLKYKIKSDTLNLFELINFKIIRKNGKLFLNKNEFSEIYNSFLKNEEIKNKYFLIFRELNKNKNKFISNFSREKLDSINVKENNFKFIAKCEVKRFYFKKTNQFSDYLIENIKIVDKMNDIFLK